MEHAASNTSKIIEERSLNAWPCLQQILYDGWILRFARGYTRRANSVNPLYPGTLNVAQKISRCWQSYQDRQLKPVFKITPFVHPANLDTLLAQAGYQKTAPTSVQVLDLTTLPPSPRNATIEQWNTPAEAWINDYVQMNQVAAANRPVLKAILHNIAPQTCFISLLNQEQTVSCGLGVLESQHVGLFDIVTKSTQRNQGFGTALILEILNWAKQQGAQKAYLQVMLSNTPALNLSSSNIFCG